MKTISLHLDSLLVHAGVDRDPLYGSITTPVYQGVTFRSIPIRGDSNPYDYSRTQNPTRESVEETLAQLEGGAAATVFASGMAAVSAVFWGGLSHGDHVVLTEDLYGGTYRLLEDELKRYGVTYDFVPTTNPEAVSAAMQPNTRMIFVESPSNPLLRVSDIAALAEIAHRHRAKLVVDNTLMTFARQRPLDLGADLVVYSASKYLAGHNDVLAGAVISKDAGEGVRMAEVANTTGGVLGPWDSYLLQRGMKTLALRMRQQETSAELLAHALAKHPNVAHVYYPQLDEAGWAVHQRQAMGPGAMVSFLLAREAQVLQFKRALKLIIPAVSLGGVESLVTEPYRETHREFPEPIRRRLGFVPGLLRLSVGIEDSRDLMDDLMQALDQV